MIHHVTFWIIGAILIKECENMCYSVMSTNGRIELLGYPPQPQTPTDPRCIDGGIILKSMDKKKQYCFAKKPNPKKMETFKCDMWLPDKDISTFPPKPASEGDNELMNSDGDNELMSSDGDNELVSYS